MTEYKRNYHYSGMSTPEAIEDFRTHFLSQLPRPIRLLIKIGVLKPAMVICCDGCGKRHRFEGNPKLVPATINGWKTSIWNGTAWTHKARLDFCGKCSIDGTAERAVADNAKPLGTYTFEPPITNN